MNKYAKALIYIRKKVGEPEAKARAPPLLRTKHLVIHNLKIFNDSLTNKKDSSLKEPFHTNN